MDLSIEQFGSKLKYIRELRDMTQKELSSKTGISSQAISNIERGYTKTLSYEDIKSLAKHLDCTVGDFFPDADTKSIIDTDIFNHLEMIIDLLEHPKATIKGVHIDAETKNILEELLKTIQNIMHIKISYKSKHKGR